MATQVDFLTVALPLVEDGWHIFPLAPGRKTPIPGTKGVHNATTDFDTILGWAAAHPTANVGLAPALSGHAVLDVDRKNGVDGLATLRGADPQLAAEVEAGLIPLTTTTSGGYHVYFATGDADIACSVGKLGAGLDVRATGGYVVAPGSYLDGSGPGGCCGHIRRQTSPDRRGPASSHVVYRRGEPFCPIREEGSARGCGD